MLVVSEKLARDLVSIEDAISAVGDAFTAGHGQRARSYPVVRELVGRADAIFGVKAGFDGSLPALGSKRAAIGLAMPQKAGATINPSSCCSTRITARRLPWCRPTI
jgi:hypothetical protein